MSPSWVVRRSEPLIEWDLAGETELLAENVVCCLCVHHECHRNGTMDTKVGGLWRHLGRHDPVLGGCSEMWVPTYRAAWHYVSLNEQFVFVMWHRSWENNHKLMKGLQPSCSKTISVHNYVLFGFLYYNWIVGAWWGFDSWQDQRFFSSVLYADQPCESSLQHDADSFPPLSAKVMNLRSCISVPRGLVHDA
jgi:hypothetical protein